MVGEQVNSEDLESQFGVPVLAINFARQPSFGCGSNMCSYPGFVYQTPPDPEEFQAVPTCSSTGYASVNEFEGGGPIDVGRTDHDAVFWTHRWGHVGYEFDIAPGEYFVVLRFAELDVDGRPEKRLFTVAVENMESAVIDIEGTVGLDVAIDLGWQVKIGNGEKLDLRLFPGDANCPSLAAMVVFEDLADLEISPQVGSAFDGSCVNHGFESHALLPRRIQERLFRPPGPAGPCQAVELVRMRIGASSRHATKERV